MTDEQIQYLSEDKFSELTVELKDLKEVKIPGLAKRIDDARQMGDLSENAEYHQAREDMAWTQSRVKEIQYILDNFEVIADDSSTGNVVGINSTITIKSEDGKEREYSIVGAQEADPALGKISNESPLGNAFFGRKKGETVIVKLPSGEKKFKIINVK